MGFRYAFAVAVVSMLLGCNDTETTTTSTTTATPPPPAPSAQLVVEKRAMDFLENPLNTVLVGTNFLYYIEVSNQGTADALGVQIRDVIPDTLKIGFLEFTELSWYDCGRVSRTVECTLTRLTPGSTFGLYVEVEAEENDVRLENVAFVNPGNLSATAFINVQ